MSKDKTIKQSINMGGAGSKAMSSMKVSQQQSPLESDEEEQYPYGKEQDDYDNMLAENMEFSDEEEQDDGSFTIHNAAQYAQPPPTKKAPKVRHGTTDLMVTSGWFDAFQKRGPKNQLQKDLVKKKKDHMDQFRKKYTQKQSHLN